MLSVPKLRLYTYASGEHYDVIIVDYVAEDTYAIKYSVYKFDRDNPSFPSDTDAPIHSHERELSHKELGRIVRMLKSTRIALMPKKKTWLACDGYDFKLEIYPDFQSMKISWDDAWPLDKIVRFLRDLALSNRASKQPWWRLRHRN